MAKQNPTVAKKVISKYTETEDAKIIEGTYEQFAPYWDAALAVRREPIQGQLMYLDEKDFLRLKEAKPTDFFDNTFADALKSSGYLQGLGLPK